MSKWFLSAGVAASSRTAFRKRRSSVALCIKLVVVLSVSLVYAVAYFYGDAAGFESRLISNHNYGRKPLSVVEIPPTVAAKQTPSPEKKETIPPQPPSLSPSPHDEANCTPPAIDEFPSDGFTRAERKRGWIVVHIVVACYCFWVLAIVCDDYFVPAIEAMCFSFKMKEDVIGATIMAAATSSPELFINCVGTFVTKGDIGVGTIVGSAVFNILAVPACCGLFAGQTVNLDWWPVSRDCLMYCLAVLGLIGTLYDGKVMWYEALLLVLAYFFYMSAMYCNDLMARKARKLISKCRRKSRVRPFREVCEVTPLLSSTCNNFGQIGGGATHVMADADEPFSHATSLYPKCDKTTSTPDSLDTISSDGSDFADDPWARGDSKWIMFVLRWPITFLLWITVPDCRKRPQLRCLTFVLSVAWIGAISYVVAYFLTIVGDTLNIPDSVMGLTILAAGMSIPEAVSSVIVTNQGHGAMGISNSIGSNTFDILLCLGLPWFIKAYFVPAVPGEQWVLLNSTGLTYSAISLLTTLFGLYIAFVANKFRLDWKIGIACTIMYVGFLILASMIELNFFFNVNLPVCAH